MSEESEKGPPPKKTSTADGRGKVLVRNSRGERHPFLRGMVTHDLVQRGLSFDDAYAAARAVRDRVASRPEITTAELKDLIDLQIEVMFDPETVARLSPVARPASELTVTYADETPQPFSRGLLVKSLFAAGLDNDRSYRLVTEFQHELERQRIVRLENNELSQRMADFLERNESGECAARYRLIRRIRRLPRPLVIYLAGASGTGKSTLALELAPLLRIYRINATDTIRQVMRMVFSPAILPALHRSSFEGGDPLDSGLFPTRRTRRGDEQSEHDLIAAFEEQATRVCVGVRAVVERAIAENMSIVVEGVHLVPDLVPFKDLTGACYQLMVLLTTLNEEVHRTRFLARGKVGGRRGERYLENFSSIRILQDELLGRAEIRDVPLLDTSDRESSLPRGLRLLTGMLQQNLRWLVEPGETSGAATPTLLLFIDGLPDRPLRALGGRTPLQAAHTPVLDRLAREGRCGLADPVSPGVVPDTASGSLAIFGQSPRAMKRGPLEALGAGLELSPGDIALRGNFATLNDEGWVVDRRAGRIREDAAELAAALDRLPLPGYRFDDVVVRVKPGTEHRLAVVLQGEELSSAIRGSDPGDGAPPGPPLTPRPLEPEDEKAAHTARILALFEQEARGILAQHPINRNRRERGLPAANAVLTRGAGRIHRLLPLEPTGFPLKVGCISGDHTVVGLAGWLGAKTVSTSVMTANLDTDLKAKFEATLEALGRNDLVILHLKGADIASHDRRSDLKVKFIQSVDRELAWLLEKHTGPLRVAVASDHTTLSELGQHAADPVPVLLWGTGVEADEVKHFDEKAVAVGGLQRFPLQLLIGRLFEVV